MSFIIIIPNSGKQGEVFLEYKCANHCHKMSQNKARLNPTHLTRIKLLQREETLGKNMNQIVKL